MIHVMLVDDQKMILEGLKNIIDWNKYGFKVVETASSAKDAISKFEKNPVDVIITDIKMPVMSGLDMIKHIKSINTRVKFILLSGYDNFEYAKKAIDYQVTEYLLKPIEETELIKVLEQLKMTINEQKAYISQQIDYYLKNALTNTLQDEVNKDDIQLFAYSKCFRYICIEIENEEDLISSKSDLSFMDANKKIRSLLVNFIGEEYENYIIKGEYEKVQFIIDDLVLNKVSDSAERFVRNLNNYIRENCEYKFTVYCGKKVSMINEIYLSKESVKLLQDIKFYKGINSVLIYDEYKDYKFSHFLSNAGILKDIVNTVKNGTEDDVKTAINKFIKNIEFEKILPESVILYVYNIVVDCCSILSDNSGNMLKYIYKFSVMKKSPYIVISTISYFIKDVCLNVKREVNEQKKKNNSGIIGDIIDYINNNYYNENINLQFFADKHFINSSYLGQLFKKKVGMSFNKYLTLIRIEQSKVLLCDKNVKIYEVAQKVGFKDANYFCVKFEEIQKLTPKEYREKMIESN
ncbi:MAG: response regulator [Clostridia bacterium]|nr:response regulator [Clostridia bacterium]